MDKAPLSQLIRIGSKLRKQSYSLTIDEQGRTCAIGAAYMAKFGEEPPTSVEHCFKALGVDHNTCWSVIRMNDICGKTREWIADWLESRGL